MQGSLKIKLSAFMFIQCFIWGAWYVSMGTYLLKVLKFSEQQVGAAYGAFAIGAMISPFFVGLIADRYFASEKLLAGLGILGGGLLFLLARFTTFESFYPMLIVYCASYAPTLALGNSLALHHLADARRDFPWVKIFFSIGWIAGGLAVSALKAEQSANQFYLAGTVSICMGLFALTLPHTPPRKTGQNVTLGQVLGLDALALLKKPSFAIFIASMFLICIPLYFYFVNMGIFLTEMGWENFAAKMTLAQVSDVVFLFLLPFILKSLGYKPTIVLGIIAWSARYFMLAGSAAGTGASTALIFGAILVHGMCYDFLFVAGQLYVDGEANERNRGAAQGFIAFILWGVGSFVGTALAGRTMNAYKLPEPAGPMAHNWSMIWSWPAWGAAAVLIVFVIFFRERRPTAADIAAEADIAAPTAGSP